jgi:deoxyadenosine/deoxycytidine kinase
MDGLVIAVESCPGGGKGFLLKHLASNGLDGTRRIDIVLQDDSIEHVVDFVHDPTRWVLVTELHFLMQHVRSIREHPKGPDAVTFVEGSPYTDFMCHFEPNEKHPLEESLYRQWYEIMRKHWHVDAHILLLSSPHEHLERIIGNSKKEQSHTTILSMYKQTERYKQVLGHAHLLVCYPNFEDNEPAMEIMKMQLTEIVQMLKNKSLHRVKPRDL